MGRAMDAGRPIYLTDLAGKSPPRLTARGRLALAFSMVAVVGLFVAMGALTERWATWQAESFGDRRLESPTPAECQIARALVRDHHDRDLAALLGGVGADGEKMELRAFAWRSSGARVPPGMDWRNCPGLGAYVRTMGFARLASGEAGPALYISRAAVNARGDAASVWETLRAPRDVRGQPVTRAWMVELTRGPGGAWRQARRTEAPLPQDDFRRP